MKLTMLWLSVLLFSTDVGPAFGQDFRFEKSLVPAAHGMYVKESGEVWLADTFKKLASRSLIYNPSGMRANGMPSGIGIGGISKHPICEDLLLSDTMGSKIFWVTSKGQRMNTFDVANPWNARWTPSGHSILVVTNAGSVLQLDGNGIATELVSGLDAPFDIAPVSDTGFWVSEQGAVGKGRVCFYSKKLNSNAYRKSVCNRGHVLDNPEGLWPLRDGSVAVVDTGLGNLLKIFPDGRTKIVARGLGVPILLQVLEGGDWVVFTNQSSVGAGLLFGNSKELL